MKRASADRVTPFLLETDHVRGRLTRLQETAGVILGRYDYPPAVARTLGELLVVAAMLSANLKQEGIFTLQIRGNGLVPLLVVDAVYGGQLRGFAEVSDASRAGIKKLGDAATPRQLFGDDAYFSLTLDPGANLQRYQGVVTLEGDTVTDALIHYFTHSQQVDILFRLAVDRRKLPGDKQKRWLAAGFMIERLPAEAGVADDGEGWRHASALANTLKEEELFDPLLGPEDLLLRLFHEEGVRVFPERELNSGCRCSRERMEKLLLSMPLIDRAEMVVDGAVTVHCQFCNTSQRFTPGQIGLNATQ